MRFDRSARGRQLDRDLATHLLRTAWLRDGVGLAEVTTRLTAAMGVRATVLPMCEQEVRTEVRVEGDGWIGYQDLLVRRGARDLALDVRWAGVESATAAPGVLEAIDGAELVILGPSDPMASLLPILAVPGVRDAIAEARARVADAFVLDAADAAEADEVAGHGLEPVVAPTLVHLDERVAAGPVAQLVSGTGATA